MNSISLQTLKKQIITLVTASKDKALLQTVAEMMCQDESAKSELYYRHSLEESIWQADAGQMKPATEVHEIARQWINK